MGVWDRDAPASQIGRRSVLLGIYFVSRLRLVSTHAGAWERAAKCVTLIFRQKNYADKLPEDRGADGQNHTGRLPPGSHRHGRDREAAASVTFGLVAFTAEQRTKEIGVRKVLGASVGNVTALIAKDFIKLVGAAFVLAMPAAYLLMQRWLDTFAYRVDISWGIFLMAGSLALAIALLTVSYQSAKAALADPVQSRQYE